MFGQHWIEFQAAPHVKINIYDSEYIFKNIQVISPNGIITGLEVLYHNGDKKFYSKNN
jgi:hypothetical protein